MSLTLLPVCGTIFLLLYCLIQFLIDVYLVSLHLVIPHLVDIPGRPALLLRETEEQRICGREE